MQWCPSSQLVVAGALLLGGTSAFAQHHNRTPPPKAASVHPSTAAAPPRIFLHDPAALVRKKRRWQADSKAEPAVTDLLAEAGRALAEKPISIVDKDVVPPSGDKHDYLSLAPYAWPDPHKPNGLPYVIRDGEVNPERDRIADHRKVTRLCAAVEMFGLAYFFSDDDRYAAQAAAFLRTFFVTPATRMNPNLNFGQGIRGKQEGRAAGIMDTACIPRLIDGVGLLASSKSWTKPDRDALDAWLREYLTWLRESDLGRKEGRAGNNHGTWYDVQVVALALATGQVELASETVNFARKRRIGRQIEPDGEQPAELGRTRPWHYAVYNLQAMVLLAGLADRVGVDLWHYQTSGGAEGSDGSEGSGGSGGRSIRKAIAWLVPFALHTKPWTLRDLDGMESAELWPVLRAAASALHDAELARAADQVAGQDGPVRDRHLALFLD
jgi:hypothetical protein